MMNFYLFCFDQQVMVLFFRKCTKFVQNTTQHNNNNNNTPQRRKWRHQIPRWRLRCRWVTFPAEAQNWVKLTRIPRVEVVHPRTCRAPVSLPVFAGRAQPWCHNNHKCAHSHPHPRHKSSSLDNLSLYPQCLKWPRPLTRKLLLSVTNFWRSLRTLVSTLAPFSSFSPRKESSTFVARVT